MDIEVRKVDFPEIEALRGLYRQEANCQIVSDSTLGRKLADAYLILVNGRTAGYGGVRNKYDPGHLMEFYLLPHLRAHALPIFRELLAVSGATHIAAQTNMPLMLLMLYDCAKNITSQVILFEDAVTTQLVCSNGIFRKAQPDDVMFEHKAEPVGEWVIEANGMVVATGGYFTHYNPPYGDIYMEVVEPARQQGYGSYLVQEVKRVCYEAGKKPAARTGTNNIASRRTLQKAGLLPCARILVGEVDLSN
jgi:GNAT superfamily N-acetyltransferase